MKFFNIFMQIQKLLKQQKIVQCTLTLTTLDIKIFNNFVGINTNNLRNKQQKAKHEKAKTSLHQLSKG